MTASVLVVYRKNLQLLRQLDLSQASVYVMLVSSSYIPDATQTGHSVLTDVSSYEITAANGYSKRGVAVSARDIRVQEYSTSVVRGATTWTASGGSISAWRYGIVYLSGSYGGQIDPVVGYFLGDVTGIDVPATTVGNTLTVLVPAMSVPFRLLTGVPETSMTGSHQSVTQSWLPVVCPGNDVAGLMAISNTVFAGTEKTFALGAGSVKICQFDTGPVTDASYYRQRYYMGMDVSQAEFNAKSYASYAEFIPYDLVRQTFYHNSPGTGSFVTGSWGTLITALQNGYTSAISVAAGPSAPSVTTPAAITFEANIPYANVPNYTSFDWNWVGGFQTAFPTNTPGYIVIETLPADFSAFVLMGNQNVAPTGPRYNTIRIVKTTPGNISTGLRAFTFTIYDSLGHATSATLNVTVTGP